MLRRGHTGVRQAPIQSDQCHWGNSGAVVHMGKWPGEAECRGWGDASTSQRMTKIAIKPLETEGRCLSELFPTALRSHLNPGLPAAELGGGTFHPSLWCLVIAAFTNESKLLAVSGTPDIVQCPWGTPSWVESHCSTRSVSGDIWRRPQGRQ